MQLEPLACMEHAMNGAGMSPHAGKLTRGQRIPLLDSLSAGNALSITRRHDANGGNKTDLAQPLSPRLDLALEEATHGQ